MSQARPKSLKVLKWAALKDRAKKDSKKPYVFSSPLARSSVFQYETTEKTHIIQFNLKFNSGRRTIFLPHGGHHAPNHDKSMRGIIEVDLYRTELPVEGVSSNFVVAILMSTTVASQLS